MRLLLIAGSSGGHLMPLLAVHAEWKMMFPESATHVLCTERREDQEALRRAGIAFTVIPALRKNLRLPWALWKNATISARVLKAFRPDAVFSKGGATGLPAVMLAHRKGIPVTLHESDAVLGRANRFAAHWAKTLCLGLPLTAYRLPLTTVVTSNPIRPEILHGQRSEGLRITGFSGARPILLVLGGSQGSVALNDAVRTHIEALLLRCDIIHITGPGKGGAEPRPGYWSRPFVLEELPHLIACATLALSRAGANTVSELAVHGVPTILVPLRGLAQDHQMKNALAAEQTGGCVVVQQEMLSVKLIPLIDELLESNKKQKEMSDAIRTLAAPAAARRIAEIIAKNLA